MTKTHYIEFPDLDIEVELDCTISAESTGIGDYEYWGEKCYDKGETYYDVDYIDWDRSIYDEATNAIIAEYIAKNKAKLIKDILNNFDPDDYV